MIQLYKNELEGIIQFVELANAAWRANPSIAGDMVLFDSNGEEMGKVTLNADADEYVFMFKENDD